VSVNIKAEALLRILDRLPSAPWSSRIDPVTMTSEWVYLSPRMAEFYGVTEAEMHGGPLALLQRVAPEDAAQFQQLMAASLQTLAPMTWTGRVLHASGASRWIEMQVVYEREDDGMIRSFGQAVDVTERKQTEQMLRTVIDALPAGVVVSRPDGHLLIHNHLADEFIGSIPEVEGGDFVQAYGVFKTDGITPFPNEELPLVRAPSAAKSPRRR
jgi:rsbT co-antagonist protein RsbR